MSMQNDENFSSNIDTVSCSVLLVLNSAYPKEFLAIHACAISYATVEINSTANT